MCHTHVHIHLSHCPYHSDCDHIVSVTMIVMSCLCGGPILCTPNKSVLFSITYRDKTIQFYINCVGYINGNLLSVYINDNLLNHIRFQFRSFWVHKTWLETKQKNKINIEYPVTPVIHRWYKTAVQTQLFVLQKHNMFFFYLESKACFYNSLCCPKFQGSNNEMRKKRLKCTGTIKFMVLTCIINIVGTIKMNYILLT